MKNKDLVLRAVANFSYGGMILKGQYFEASTKRDYDGLVRLKLAEPTEVVEPVELVDIKVPQQTPDTGAIVTPVVKADNDWAEDLEPPKEDKPEDVDEFGADNDFVEDENETVAILAEHIEAVKTHAELDALVAAHNIQNVPNRDDEGATLAVRKVAAAENAEQ